MTDVPSLCISLFMVLMSLFSIVNSGGLGGLEHAVKCYTCMKSKNKVSEEEERES